MKYSEKLRQEAFDKLHAVLSPQELLQRAKMWEEIEREEEIKRALPRRGPIKLGFLSRIFMWNDGGTL